MCHILFFEIVHKTKGRFLVWPLGVSSGVAAINGKGIIQKRLAQLPGPGLIMRGNYIQINLIIYSTLQTHQSTY